MVREETSLIHPGGLGKAAVGAVPDKKFSK
jgi:hypothetical protein